MWTKNKSLPVIIVVLILSLLYLYNLVPSVLSWGPSGNYENVSVRTTVNVSGAYPEILNVTCNNDTTITLNAGSTRTVVCLVEIRDYDGGSTINTTNGTFYYYLNESSDPDDNNTHYTNTSCSEDNANGYYANWTCAFDVLYYANNGTWEINVTVKDSDNNTDNDYGNSSIDILYALNVTSVIDFGNMAVDDTTTTAVEANITNFGNMDINVSVFGFGGNDSITGAGLAMICAIRNISISNERWDLSSATPYATMTPITGAPDYLDGLTIPQQTDDTQQEINSTYWGLHVNVTTNPFGICNGTVVFAAEVP